MAAPPTASAFLLLVRKSGLLSEETLARLNDESLPAEPIACAERLVRLDLLTSFQAKQLLSGRYRGLVLGPYRILRLLGRGGMGTVYLADHTTLNRKVALKILSAQKGNDPLSLERFYREARAVAALDHPNIVRLFDVSQVQDIRFLVMEHVDGLNLETLIEQAGPLHHAQAAGYVVQAAAGLQHAHEKGFVHRDIKPANLVLAKDGTVKILDMGLTRSVGNPKDDLTSRFDESAVSGTADFASPEQALNVAIDARSDIYSLGATLFTLVTGQAPFGGTTTQKLTQHQLSAPPDLCKLRPSAPAGLGAVVGRMMAKAPRDRYQTAREVIEALAPWAQPDAAPPGVSAQTPAPKEQLRVPEKPALARPVHPKAAPNSDRRKQWIAAGGIALLAVVAGLALAFARGKKPAETVQPPPNPNASPATGSDPDPKVPAGPEVFAYRLDLSATKPFVHSHIGRTIDAPPAFAGAPDGWGTHSWYVDCTHEFFAAPRGTQMGLGIRFTSRPANNTPAGMLFVRGIAVEPNRAYTIRVVYQTSGSVSPGDVRVRESQTNRLRIVGKDRLTQTSGAWTTLTLPYKNGDTNQIQVEFHHNGPLGTDNELMVRVLDVIDAEPR